MARLDYEEIAERYEAARATSLAALEPWRVALAPHIESRDIVLDVGAGTGMFAVAIAEWFEARVIGVEPSHSMRGRAAEGRRHALVHYVAGCAERLPLRRAACHVAWLSTVLHHFEDLPRCAHEIGNVLAPASKVLIRNAFPGRLDHVTLFRYFPEARDVAETYPTVATTVAAFGAAGFDHVSLERVAQQWAPSMRAYADRVRLRADTTLALLSETQFASGLRELDADAAAESDPSPVIDGLDLLLFSRTEDS
jgi:ubiquinone/menaquinone biosynthesis C-methylase UbiE